MLSASSPSDNARQEIPVPGRALMEPVLLDAAAHRRSPATIPGYHREPPPRNKGEEYPADPR